VNEIQIAPLVASLAFLMAGARVNAPREIPPSPPSPSFCVIHPVAFLQPFSRPPKHRSPSHFNTFRSLFRLKQLFFQNVYLISTLKGIVSRDFVVCFLVSIDRSHISTHQEWVLLLLKVLRLHVEFFDFRVWA
jgi:hypothetical protein